MNIFAYCCQSFRYSVKRATGGVEPLLSPPNHSGNFDPLWLQGRHLLYFKLHGLPDQPYWYGDDWTTAISADHIRAATLNDATVFVANCHLNQDAPMLKALFDAGAKFVIGGPGPNYAGRQRVFGADLLGMIFRHILALQIQAPIVKPNPRVAFTIAKARLRLGRQDRIKRDTLEFQLYERKDIRV